jgi:hypothetical protein
MCECGDFIIWDANTQTVYSSAGSHYSGRMNPMVDLRTRHGHAMLWARQIEIDASCDDWLNAIRQEYKLVPFPSESHEYRAYACVK